jgi:hypothetical protein
MGRNQQTEKLELRLEQAKKDFEAKLRACLPECARGRWGLFGQHERNHGAEFAKKYYSWPEAEKVIALAEEVRTLRETLVDTSPFPNEAGRTVRAERPRLLDITQVCSRTCGRLL